MGRRGKGNVPLGLWVALLALCGLWNLSLYRFTGPADANPPGHIGMQPLAGALFLLLLGLGLLMAAVFRRRRLALAVAVYGWLETAAMLLLALCLWAGPRFPGLPARLGGALFAAVYLLWMALALTGAPLLALRGSVAGGCCAGLAVAAAATLCYVRIRRREGRAN